PSRRAAPRLPPAPGHLLPAVGPRRGRGGPVAGTGRRGRLYGGALRGAGQILRAPGQRPGRGPGVDAAGHRGDPAPPGPAPRHPRVRAEPSRGDGSRFGRAHPPPEPAGAQTGPPSLSPPLSPFPRRPPRLRSRPELVVQP